MKRLQDDPTTERWPRVGLGILLMCAGFAALPATAGVSGEVALQVARGPESGELTLSFSGSNPAYRAYRSEDPASVAIGPNLVAHTLLQSAVIGEGTADLYFFTVVGSPAVDAASTVGTTSDCLTAGTSAQAVVVVDLRDSIGLPLEGAIVTIATDAGSIGPVSAQAGEYWATLTPPAVTAGPATISVMANGTPLGSQPVVSFADPFGDLAGGVGGCPADGNVRVRVVSEAGIPIQGARVMIGPSESLNVFQTEWQAAPDGDNTGVTDPYGFTEFRDLSSNLDGPLTVTAAAADRRYLTFIDADAADLVLSLPLVYPDSPTGSLTGVVAPVPAPANDPIEFALVLSDLRLDALLGFSPEGLLGDLECYSAGGVAGDVGLQSNVYIPAQCALSVFICLQSLPEHPYTLPLPYGERKLLSLRADAPLSVLAGGDPSALLTAASLNGIGVETTDVASPGPVAQNVGITESLNPNVSCTMSGLPPFADGLCLVGGDWDSASGGLLPGEGRLFAMGYGVQLSSEPGPVTGITTVPRVGDFAGIDYISAAVAQYLDPLDPNIPSGTADGSSAVLDRSGADLGGAAALSFDGFFPIRTLARAGREFSLSALPGTSHPPAHISRAVVEQVVRETYIACIPEQRVRRFTLWEVFAPGSANGWTLPTPPPGWPRESAGGDLAGLIDPAETLEDDSLNWKSETMHLGTLPTFDRLRLTDVGRNLTHVSTNHRDY